jgi:hypothetical protein
MFGEMLILSGWEIAKLNTRTPSLDDLIDTIHRSIDTIRAAAGGEGAKVRALIAFTGFRTVGDTQVATPWGTFRPLTTWERELAPPGLEGTVSGSDQDGAPVVLSYAGEMVLDTEVPYALHIDPRPFGADVSEPWPSIQGADSLRRRIESVQLAAILALHRPVDRLVMAKLSWIRIADPFTHGPSISWSDPKTPPSFTPDELDPDECKSMATWAELIEQRWAPRVDIAVRRSLMAASSRTDMADRLVDSVIVWENLFGTSQGEPRLRISAAMSWLLASTAASREELQSILRKLYDYRSQIVHGGTFDELALIQHANDALAYALEALRALIRDRPDVLTLPDGAARSLRLIMGG